VSTDTAVNFYFAQKCFYIFVHHCPGLLVNGYLNLFSHFTSSWVEIGLHIEFQLPRLSGSRFGSFRGDCKVTLICWFIFIIVWLK
jgi:hypothetical protein